MVIDDGSTDDTLERTRSFEDDRIRIHSDGRSLGLAARLNQAIELSTGDYFARMDGDDIAYPERLERQVAVLDDAPEIDLVGSQMLVFGKGGKAKRLSSLPGWPPGDLRSSSLRFRPRPSHVVRPAQVVRAVPLRCRRSQMRGPRSPSEELRTEPVRERSGDPPRVSRGADRPPQDPVVSLSPRGKRGPLPRLDPWRSLMARSSRLRKGATDAAAVAFGAESGCWDIGIDRCRPAPSRDGQRSGGRSVEHEGLSGAIETWIDAG